jgi:hypothetical protein
MGDGAGVAVARLVSYEEKGQFFFKPGAAAFPAGAFSKSWKSSLNSVIRRLVSFAKHAAFTAGVIDPGL